LPCSRGAADSVARRSQLSRRERGEEVVEVRWLRNVRVEPCIVRTLAILWLRVTAQRHEPSVPELPVAPKRSGHIVPVHVRQPDVAEDDVRPEFVRQGDAGTAVTSDPELWPCIARTSA
jgi:hypothetical protein